MATHPQRVVHLWDDLVRSAGSCVALLPFPLQLLALDFWQSDVVPIGVKVKLWLPVLVPVYDSQQPGHIETC